LRHIVGDLMQFRIIGGSPLNGTVKISAAKNASLPIIAASILPSTGETKIENLPLVTDVLTLKSALEKIGVCINISDSYATINASGIKHTILPEDDTKKLRASFFVTGALLAKFGEVTVSEPGGCVIGSRPIDFHLRGFETLGAKIERVNENYVKIKAVKLRGNTINLPFPSVGATENLMMAACLAEGQTIINNAALEPEIVDLAIFLRKMGARIKGAGSSLIKIDGVKKLDAVDYKVIPDRIEAGSYMIAAAMTGGHVTVNNVIPAHLASVTAALIKVGASVTVKDDYQSITVKGTNSFNPLNVVTECFPGFPTDLQPLLTSLMSLSNGVGTITDTVFPKRFCYVAELKRMGADITVINNLAVVRGVKKLQGAEVYATDLRGGFALILAGLVAKDKTTIKNIDYIDRGYENLVQKLKQLGANINREITFDSSLKDTTSICLKDKK
jgi:UDP-N-acetylglucosamine 1-carboxyvinyltransferase